ncbi:MAG: flagellar motor switch protein FliM [Planctomycetota bacterium]|jgi:flagellar motor switch protein FliM|nr:flagellar motor switch protein FliM [Planctomycetota bacterium]
MPDQLSQNEIDALLNSPDLGKDVDAAPAVAKPAVKEELPQDVKFYDFKRPERVSQDQLRSIEMMHEVLARKLGASLSAYLRTIVEVKITEVPQLTYNEFILSVPNPTCFNILKCEPLNGSMVLEINPSIVFPILDKLLGGGHGEPLILARELSDIEWRLINHITNETLVFLRDCWKPIMDIDFMVAGRESNNALMQIVPPNEVVIVVSFEISMVNVGNSRGMMNLCIPFPVIESIMSEFSTIQTWFQSKRNTDASMENAKLNDGMKSAQLETIVYIGGSRITLRDLLRLQVGDLILTKKNVTDPLLLTIAGQPKFWVYPGQHRHYKAVRVERETVIDDKL